VARRPNCQKRTGKPGKQYRGAHQAQGAFQRVSEAATEDVQPYEAIYSVSQYLPFVEVKEIGDPVMNHQHRTHTVGRYPSCQSEKRKFRKGDNYYQRSPHGRETAPSSPKAPTLVGGWYPRYLHTRPRDPNGKRRAFLAARKTSPLALGAGVGMVG